MKWREVRNILCVRLDSMGDLLMTTPALRASWQEGRCRLTLLTSKAGAVVASSIPEISDVIVYEAPWMKAAAVSQFRDVDSEIIERLRERGFDAAVIFTVFSQNPLPSALLTYLAGIPLRLAHCRENPYGLLTHWLPETEPERGIQHEVERQLRLVSHVGYDCQRRNLEIHVAQESLAKTTALRERLSIGGKWILIHPGASAASRRYPPHLFSQVATGLIERGFTIVLSGDSSERELVRDIQKDIKGRALSVAGDLEFTDLAALIHSAPLVLTNNTGPAHISAAVGTPVVVLYALTNPQHTPWMVPSIVLSHDVPCGNCFKSVCPEGHNNCLSLIKPERVIDACLTLWRKQHKPHQETTHAHLGN